ncbi:hypothetical protein [Urechidicola croceus]|uniref:Uncharacterized protein n=1 Tax=Urechidicola croceus TaxID=1850246 RepID=A0A1D8P7C2_9FLAO|nr:hypothetical protein [Urechidicola croceus]AOW20487.1 hypothetical protein LPB138_07280 [Urechidicola croceus]
MKTALIISKHFDFLSVNFISNLIDKNKEYHVCFVREIQKSYDYFDYLENRTKSEQIDFSLVNIRNKNITPEKAAKRYLNTRREINNIVVIDESNLSMLFDLLS